MKILLIIVICLVITYLWLHFRENKDTETENVFENNKSLQGMVPGGMYSGISFTPGDPLGDWSIGERYDICPACEKGDLFYYWQDKYYKLKCNNCGYLHDTGEKLSQEQQKRMAEMIQEVRESERMM